MAQSERREVVAVQFRSSIRRRRRVPLWLRLAVAALLAAVVAVAVSYSLRKMNF